MEGHLRVDDEGAPRGAPPRCVHAGNRPVRRGPLEALPDQAGRRERALQRAPHPRVSKWSSLLLSPSLRLPPKQKPPPVSPRGLESPRTLLLRLELGQRLQDRQPVCAGRLPALNLFDLVLLRILLRRVAEDDDRRGGYAPLLGGVAVFLVDRKSTRLNS